MRTFRIFTLGCKVNRYEEQLIRESLIDAGFTEVLSGADAVIVNSCTVTSKADAKTRRSIAKLRKENPDACIAVTGCYAVVIEDIRYLESMQDVDIVIPGRDKALLPEILGEALGVPVGKADFEKGISGFGSRTRAFLKVQDGCDNRCAYCKVNLVRGPSMSRGKYPVVREFRDLVDAGFSEIVLTGICLGDWKDKSGGTLADLVRAVSRVPGEYRIRLSSIEPHLVDNALIDVVAYSRKVCSHLHIPLQSGSDKILKHMGRKYTTSGFLRVVDRVREKIEDVGLTMDVIAGFPGETDKDFTRTLELIERIAPSRTHVFTYSDRKGTPAYNMPDKVPEKTKKERVKALLAAADSAQRKFTNSFIGKRVVVMPELIDEDGFPEGYTGQYVRAKVLSSALPCGGFLTGKAEDIDRNEPVLIVRPEENTKAPRKVNK